MNNPAVRPLALLLLVSLVTAAAAHSGEGVEDKQHHETSSGALDSLGNSYPEGTLTAVVTGSSLTLVLSALALLHYRKTGSSDGRSS
ncbi:MAG: hypothetical protein ABEJ03_04145 [Candidatus Nanohaloarchaea archaeon]